MIKKLYLTLAIICINLSWSGEIFAQSASLSLSPATGTFNKGCDVSVDIIVNTGGAQTDGTDVILFYDPTRLKANQINNGTIYSDYSGNTIDETNGKIAVSGLSSVSSSFSGQGVIASIDFTVLADAPVGATQIRFDFDPNDKAKTTDSNVVERGVVADILSQVTNGNYTIGTGNCTGGVVGAVTPTPRGSTDFPIVTQPQAFPTKTLSPTADFTTTWVIAAAGTTLVVLAILGMAVL